ncbi:MAG: hypothetical protein QW279_12230 [Candidatus Jordarchaeaceae archaeon]
MVKDNVSKEKDSQWHSFTRVWLMFIGKLEYQEIQNIRLLEQLAGENTIEAGYKY